MLPGAVVLKVPFFGGVKDFEGEKVLYGCTMI